MEKVRRIGLKELAVPPAAMLASGLLQTHRRRSTLLRRIVKTALARAGNQLYSRRGEYLVQHQEPWIGITLLDIPQRFFRQANESRILALRHAVQL